VHLRIACSVDELLAGCSGGGPYWEWLPAVPLPVTLDDGKLALLIADEPPLELLPSAGGGDPVASVPSVASE
jgi:penicillin-insensitive murein endopeptidase